jgi:hypothetical protein
MREGNRSAKTFSAVSFCSSTLSRDCTYKRCHKVEMEKELAQDVTKIQKGGSTCVRTELIFIFSCLLVNLSLIANTSSSPTLGPDGFFFSTRVPCTLRHKHSTAPHLRRINFTGLPIDSDSSVSLRSFSSMPVRRPMSAKEHESRSLKSSSTRAW